VNLNTSFYIFCFSVGERLSVGMNLLLAMALFLQNTSSMMPGNTLNVPLYSVFVMLTMLSQFMGVICISYNITIYFIDSSLVKLPLCFRYVVLGQLAPMLGINTTYEVPKWRKMYNDLQQVNHEGIKASLGGEAAVEAWMNSLSDGSITPIEMKNRLEDIWGKYVVYDMSVKTSILLKKFADVHDETWRQQEWRIVAYTFDSLLFYVFLGTYTFIFSLLVGAAVF
jgi:hypothetical protein